MLRQSLGRRFQDARAIFRRPSTGIKKGGLLGPPLYKTSLEPCLVPGQSEALPGLKSYFLDFFDFLAFFAFFAFFAFLAIASSSELMD
jgi:hypothetical protein